MIGRRGFLGALGAFAASPWVAKFTPYLPEVVQRRLGLVTPSWVVQETARAFAESLKSQRQTDRFYDDQYMRRRSVNVEE